jgi:hypothetical protein
MRAQIAAAVAFAAACSASAYAYLDGRTTRYGKPDSSSPPWHGGGDETLQPLQPIVRDISISGEITLPPERG